MEFIHQLIALISAICAHVTCVTPPEDHLFCRSAMLKMPHNRSYVKLKFNSICVFSIAWLLMQYLPTRLFCFVFETIKWANMIGKAVKIASWDARSSKKYCFWGFCQDHRVLVSQSTSFGRQSRSQSKLPASWPHIQTGFLENRQSANRPPLRGILPMMPFSGDFRVI